MRSDLLEARATVNQPPARVWEIVGAPELYPRYFPGITWCEQLTTDGRGVGARYLVRITLTDGTIAEDEIEALVYRPGDQVVWSSQHAPDRWVSVQLEPRGNRGTRINVQIRVSADDDPTGSKLIASVITARLRTAANLIASHLDGTPAPLAGGSDDPGAEAASIAADARVLSRAGILTPARPDKLLRQLNALGRWGATFVGGYRSAAVRVPHDIALYDEHDHRTFADLDNRSTRLANALRRYGVEASSTVALLCRNHIAMVESMVACGKLGADVVLLSTSLSGDQATRVIREHEPVVLLADDEFDDLIEDLPRDVARISTYWTDNSDRTTVEDLVRKGSTTAQAPVSEPGRTVLLTAGTTGPPKGARRPTPKRMNTVATLLARLPLHAGEGMFIAAPIFQVSGLTALQLGMALRSRVVLRRRFDAEATLAAIEEHRCASLFAAPIMLQRILDLPDRVRARYDTSCLKVVASSGSALSARFVTDFMDAFGEVLYNLYGSAEASWASIADPTDLRAAPTTAGRCPPGTVLGILGPDGRPAPAGAVGPIAVRNDMLFDGYTNGSTIPLVHRLLPTGDHGYVDANGRLFVSGRVDEMIVTAGENVFPHPVEDALMALPEVREAAVIGVPDNEYGQRLAAYIVLRQGSLLDADSVRGYIRKRVARFAVPRDVTFVRRLPRNAAGKVLKRLLYDGTW